MVYFYNICVYIYIHIYTYSYIKMCAYAFMYCELQEYVVIFHVLLARFQVPR